MSNAAAKLDRFAQRRPDVVLIAPMLAYLLLLGAKDWAGADNYWLTALLRGVGGLLPVWLFWRHYPDWGRPYAGLALVCGLIAAFGWYYGQLLLNWLGVPVTLPLPFFDDVEFRDPRAVLAEEQGYWTRALGVSAVFWLDVVTRILVASVTVPIVEELFWRAFLLRALIDWDDFERVPLGQPSARANIITSLLSAIQHPYNWAISIPCWLFFNGLMFWRKSILFLILVHGFTNLFLYAWVIYRGAYCGEAVAWSFW